MQASLIIPTLNRKELLLKALASLQGQSFSDFEILIIDQSDHPLLLDDLPQMEQEIRLFYLQEKNLPQARNLGAQKAQGQEEAIGKNLDRPDFKQDWMHQRYSRLG